MTNSPDGKIVSDPYSKSASSQNCHINKNLFGRGQSKKSLVQKRWDRFDWNFILDKLRFYLQEKITNAFLNCFKLYFPRVILSKGLSDKLQNLTISIILKQFKFEIMFVEENFKFPNIFPFQKSVLELAKCCQNF